MFGTEKRKSVSWAADVVEPRPTKRVKKIPAKDKLYHRMQKKIFASAKAHDGGALYDDYIRYYELTSKAVQTFYREYCGSIFYIAVISWKTIDLLSFFIGRLNKLSAAYLLKYNNFRVLNAFVRSHGYARERGGYTQERRQNRIQRLAILLRLHRATVVSFMEDPKSQDSIPEEVRSEYQEALALVDSDDVLVTSEGEDATQCSSARRL